MCIDPTAPTARTTKAAPARFIRWERHAGHACGIVRISVAGVATRYFLSPGMYGEVVWKKLSPGGAVVETYRVSLCEDGGRCGCKGHRRWGACRHVSALAAMAAANRL